MQVKNLIAKAIVLSLLGMLLPLGGTTAQAASLTTVKDTLASNNPGDTPVHTIEFVPGTAGTAIKEIQIEFNQAASTPASAANFDTTGATLDSESGFATSDLALAEDGTTVTLTKAGAAETAAGGVTLAISGMANPATTGTYYLEIRTYSDAGTTLIDRAYTAFALKDATTVRARVLSTFTFTVDTSDLNLTGTQGAGILDSSEVADATQDLTVATNASGGYAITIEDDGNLRSSAGDDIDDVVDGTIDAGTEEYGVALTTVSTDAGTTGSGDFALTTTYNDITTTAEELLSASGPVAGSVASQLTYAASITGLTPAGDYAHDVTLIATPSF